MKIVVGSKSPIKLEVVEQAFKTVFDDASIEVVGCNANSDVAEQPMGREETKAGAKNRANNAKEIISGADFWVGLEGGLVEEGESLFCVAWMCVVNKEGAESFSHTASFQIPPEIVTRIKAGEELSDAANTALHAAEDNRDTVGMLTDGVISRAEYYIPALVLALIPFAKSELYNNS